ncbi:MAG: cardiolipin synthase [Halobacteriovoraceae bacterium]|nr:cardiolipin synthase [Halobacteriovoraceae bacterium]
MLEAWLLSLHSESYLKLIFVSILIFISLLTSFHAVIYKSDPRSAVGWFAFILTAPILGTLTYFFLGLNRVQRKGLRLDQLPRSNNNSIPKINESNISSEFHFLLKVGKNLSYSPLCSIDTITPLNTGDQAYPQMLKAIETAKNSITLYSYIFHYDKVGKLFVDSLAQASQRGVFIRILVDGVGSQSSLSKLQESFEKANITFDIFLPVLWRPRFANLRNHRKILVIDNQMAFVGGLNIAQDYWPQIYPEKPVLDFHFSLEGEIVRYIQAVFVDDWKFVTQEDLVQKLLLEDSPTFNVKSEKNAYGRIITSGPGDNSEKMQWHFISAINNAQNSIKIVSPYFLPSKAVSSALVYASLRGIKVEIIIPQKTDHQIINWAQQASLHELLSKGCHLYFSQAPFDHSKILIIDDNYSSIGSSNWDVRSLRLNFEMNIEIGNKDLAESLIQVFKDKKKKARIYTLEEYNNRTFLVKLRGGFARMLSPYL